MKFICINCCSSLKEYLQVFKIHMAESGLQDIFLHAPPALSLSSSIFYVSVFLSYICHLLFICYLCIVYLCIIITMSIFIQCSQFSTRVSEVVDLFLSQKSLLCYSWIDNVPIPQSWELALVAGKHYYNFLRPSKDIILSAFQLLIC